VQRGHTTLRRKIEGLLRAPTSGADAPTVAHLEETLTDGYARALVLEAERWRLERRLGQAARELEHDAAAGVAEEMGSLARRLETTDGELTKLRSLLGLLYMRTRAARAVS
jgi:ABC-type phosphate transport system auxiliary subunit